jgi:hypothetical protein
MSDRCPVCLGSGAVLANSFSANARRTDKFPAVLVTCVVCHGSGERPDWMNDERGSGHREPGYDYAKNQ